MGKRILRVLGFVMVLLFVAACGGRTPAVSPPTAAPTPAATPPKVEAPVTPAATPVTARTPPVVSPATPKAPPTGDPLIAKGEEVFQRTAGGVGCQACHGRDARGAVGPDIRGATVTRISSALSSVEQMAFIKLSPEEVQAVSAYLQFLATQP